MADGDTITLLAAGNDQIKIRISGIDAPETRQAFGQSSKKNLLDLVAQREAQAYCGKKDRYGRSICRVEVGGVDVGLKQIRDGLAWHYKAYEKEQPEAERQEYASAEVVACKAHKGLWADKAPVAPWDWRKAAKVKDGPPAVTPASSYPCMK